jgi:hypothetical protein
MHNDFNGLQIIGIWLANLLDYSGDDEPDIQSSNRPSLSQNWRQSPLRQPSRNDLRSNRKCGRVDDLRPLRQSAGKASRQSCQIRSQDNVQTQASSYPAFWFQDVRQSQVHPGAGQQCGFLFVRDRAHRRDGSLVCRQRLSPLNCSAGVGREEPGAVAAIPPAKEGWNPVQLEPIGTSHLSEQDTRRVLRASDRMAWRAKFMRAMSEKKDQQRADVAAAIARESR